MAKYSYTLQIVDRHGKPKKDVCVVTTVTIVTLLEQHTDAQGKVRFEFEQPYNLIFVRVNDKRVRTLVPVFGNVEDHLRL